MPIQDSSHEYQSDGATHDIAEDRAAKLDQVRSELVELVADVKSVVEARAMQIKNSTVESSEAGADFARDTIRSHPLPAIAVAAIVGAAVAIALTPASRHSRSAPLPAWAPDGTRTNFGEMAQELQRTASTNGSSLLSAFERVVDAVSTIDPKSSLTPTLEKAGAWLTSMRGFMSGK